MTAHPSFNADWQRLMDEDLHDEAVAAFVEEAHLCECGCGGTPSKARSRWLPGHHNPQRNMQCYLVDEAGCWVWQLCRNAGYGVIRFQGRARRAHIVYWEHANGPVPEGLQLDHLCRNRACVNPAHLEPVTQVENIRRGAVAKITMEIAEAIRASDETPAVLAKRYGISPAHVRNIRAGRSWRPSPLVEERKEAA